MRSTALFLKTPLLASRALFSKNLETAKSPVFKNLETPQEPCFQKQVKEATDFNAAKEKKTANTHAGARVAGAAAKALRQGVADQEQGEAKSEEVGSAAGDSPVFKNTPLNPKSALAELTEFLKEVGELVPAPAYISQMRRRLKDLSDAGGADALPCRA